MLLALDTATRQAGMALYDGDELRAELLWQAGRHHTERMAPALQQLLALARARMRDVRAVAVSLGPGSFTGLRIGLALGKGIATASGLPLLGIPTLDATAYPHLAGETPVCAVVQAGRGRLAAAFYAPEDEWQPGPLQRGSVDEIAALASGPTRFVGELLPAERQRLTALLGAQARLPEPALATRRPSAIAALGWARFQRGERDDPATLAPIYLTTAGIETA